VASSFFLQIPLIAIRISTLVVVVLANARINVAHNNQGYKTWTSTSNPKHWKKLKYPDQSLKKQSVNQSRPLRAFLGEVAGTHSSPSPSPSDSTMCPGLPFLGLFGGVTGPSCDWSFSDPFTFRGLFVTSSFNGSRLRFPALVLDPQFSDPSSAPSFSSPSSSLMYSMEVPAETDGRLDFCLADLLLRFDRECREDFLARLGERSSGLLFLTAHSTSMILSFQGSLVRRWDRVTGSTVYSPLLKFCVIRDVCPRFSVEFQGDLQTTSIEKVRR
jgi:hypothetical protein